MPDIAQIIRAAHYLHVPPWDLMQQPIVWLNWSLAVMTAEAQAAHEQTASMFGKSKK